MLFSEIMLFKKTCLYFIKNKSLLILQKSNFNSD